MIFYRTGPNGPRRWPAPRVSALVRNLDLAPTLLELAGIEVPKQFEGLSLVPLLEGAASPAHGSRRSFAWVGTLRSLTTEHWHLVTSTQSGPLKLYDNESDPDGSKNLKSRYPEIVAEMFTVVEEFERARLRTIELGRQIASPTQPGQETLDPEIIEQLEALGYLE